MGGGVTMRAVPAVPILVVPARTSWSEFPMLWRRLLDEVWGCLHTAGITGGCRNVMLYLDDQPQVEVGVLLPASLRLPRLTGRVVVSTLPEGSVAATMHRGPYDALAAAHRDVLRWCAAHGLRPAGPRWEIYGPHRDDPAQLEVEVFYLLTAVTATG